ncbi:hypothetical protein EIP86_001172 [Pleurotus ostreatoroseus]|nr:hypothetical protein EIP86_001172 [Pleurotus ostreatoroseus]
MESALERQTMPTVLLSRLIDLEITDSHPYEQILVLQRILPAPDVRVFFRSWSLSDRDLLDFPMAPFIQAINEKYVSKKRNALSCHPTLLEFDVSTDHDQQVERGTTVRVKLSAPLVATECPKYDFIDATRIVEVELWALSLSPDDAYKPICDMLSTTFSLSAVKTLYLSCGPKTIPESWRDVFLKMMHLDTICIIRTSRVDGDLVRMLGPPEVQAQETGLTVLSQQILFPALRLLSIEEQISLDSMNFDLLLETLRLRKTAGLTVCDIKLVTWDVVNFVLELLKRLVAATGTTTGRAETWIEIVVIPYGNANGPFSTPDNSGSIVLTRDGRIFGIQYPRVTYLIPY